AENSDLAEVKCHEREPSLGVNERWFSRTSNLRSQP
ncbi:MAG: hypothetical protein ACI81R_001630, partial [Bradymonadia bacterium]